MIRRFASVSLAVLTALAPAMAPVAAWADGPPAGDRVYRPARAVSRPVAPVPDYAPAPVADQVLRIDLTAGPGARTLNLPRGKSAIIELPSDVRDLLVTNPQVADAVLRNPRRIYVLGLGKGTTDAVFFDAAGRRLLSLNIRVDEDAGALQETLRRVLPDARIEVQPVRDSLILTGMVANAAEATTASQIAAQFVSKPEQVVNLLTVAGKDQVTLKVRVIEVQRNIVKQLGVNVSAALNQLGSNNFSIGYEPKYTINSGLQGGGTIGATIGGSNNSATASVQALERVGLIRTLSEPNLTAVSGEAGRFLVGGEFPVPVDMSETGKVTLQFKPYGVSLGYTPVVLSGGRISLKLSTEVSELTSVGAYTLSSGTSTIVVPGLSVRRAETTVELPSGGSLMIAGLLQQQSKENIDALPGLKSLPILGGLFRSRDYLNGETELVILVTPYIVDPTKPGDLQTPADGLRLAGDMGTVLLGRLNTVVNAPAGANANRSYQGPVGYVIE